MLKTFYIIFCLFCAYVGCQYGRVNFWDTYFADESEPFEWYFDYSVFRETVIDSMPRDCKVLIAGIGNSHLAEDVSIL